ncbi:hypothetical protein C3R30_22050, partial [Mycobacterium tuberculosis]
GQEDAGKAGAKASRRTRAGRKDPKRPAGAGIVAGPAGGGKTERAKARATGGGGGERGGKRHTEAPARKDAAARRTAAERAGASRATGRGPARSRGGAGSHGPTDAA